MNEGTAIDLEALVALRDSREADEALAGLPIERLGEALDRASAALEGGPADARAAREHAWRLLDLVRRSAVVRRIPAGEADGWSRRVLRLIEAAHYTVGRMFVERAEAYGSKVLFQIPEPVGVRTLSWRRAASRVEQTARGLIALDPDGRPGPVAVLAENRIDTALVDLTCLATGIVDVMVPANSTPDDVAFMLRHSHARTAVVSGPGQLRKLAAHRESLPDLRHVVVVDRADAGAPNVITLEALAARAEQVPAAEVRRRIDAVRIDDLATIMYTSGTTGMPKGIQFSQRNLVFKRFARGIAIPEIGENDVFLCFLPLFHTFGRFLELLGCVFWGATYCFLDNPSVEALVRGMRFHRPTVFISVPKKWMQLHEAIAQRADPFTASDDELARAVREVTGGRLRWGLSAAGHLDPDVFRFFQRQGVELMSGFGMTEATGGITMTPPGRYRDESLGAALPGIDLKLADDGELCIRGPYVMIGYLDPPAGERSFDDEGWFHSGDLMERDAEGFLRLVDRKKEIYKNIKGETIAPQRIENLFREFDAIGRAFLVGDHREYNTLLVWPNPGFTEIDFSTLPPQKVKDHFRSLVVSVNQFLAPYERIVDFALIGRDLDETHGELTAKGTPRRRKVVENFGDTIHLLYRRTNLQVGGLELTLPNWFLQSAGLLAQDIRVGEDRIVMPHTGTSLTVRAINARTARIGACLYAHPAGAINLGALLTAPRLWLGNDELVDFLPLETAQRSRAGRVEEGIAWQGRAEPATARPDEVQRLDDAHRRGSRDLLDLHLAAHLLASEGERGALSAVRYLQAIVAAGDDPIAEPARGLLARAASVASDTVARRALVALVPAERDARFRGTLESFLGPRPELLDEDSRTELRRLSLTPAKLDAFVEMARSACLAQDDASAARASVLVRFLAGYGAGHPASYRRLRAFLLRTSLFAAAEDVRRHAADANEAMQRGFRQWLGPSARIAVDPETGQEYQWDDVVVFDEAVPEEDRSRMLSAIKTTPLLREASFLFSKGVLLRLDDLPPGGIWIRPLGSKHGKSVYRVTMQTRFQGAYDLAVNVNHALSRDEMREEIQWLILTGESADREPLVEEFGGYWPRQDLWSEEFVSGETLDRALRRLARRQGEEDRLQQLWPFLAWTTLSAYVDFWRRCGERWEIADPSLGSVIAPTDDFHTGVRIVSVSGRRPHRGVLEMLRSFMDELVRPAEEQYPILASLVRWNVVFSAFLEVLGEEEGLARLRRALAEERADGEMRDTLERYCAGVEARGFLPRRLYFAVERYRRWDTLGGGPTPQARARTLQELYDTYGLQRLAEDYPETRVRIFRETIFRDAPPPLAEGLDELIRRLRANELKLDDLFDAIAELRERLQLGGDADYYLARISLPYLRPEDAADFVVSDLGGRHQTDIVVNLEDHDGARFRVRHALNPKEVARLHRLFVSAKLDVRFRPEHRYLVAITDRQHLIAGIYYEIEQATASAHLEKIVVTDAFRRKGVADGLMTELFNRLRAAGVKTVTTGFFRPEYFYGYGFRIEKRYAGLVKDLTKEEPAGR